MTIQGVAIAALRRLLGCALALSALLAAAPPAAARTILFVGNSFTFGGGSAVRILHPEYVTDLNGTGMGGVPALFAAFARQTGLDWQVSLETEPGKDLAYHYAAKRHELAGKWDMVLLQGFSTLDPARPGDPTRHIQAAAELAAMFRAENPQARIELVSTWSRADLTFRRGGHWYGKPITQMAKDVAAANGRAVRSTPDLAGAIPVGLAWNRAITQGLADPDPFNGVSFGKINLWTWDQYHASAEGYYLAALVIFGRVTGIDPRTLGEHEQAGNELGIAPTWIKALQAVAAEELAAKAHAPVVTAKLRLPAGKRSARPAV